MNLFDNRCRPSYWGQGKQKVKLTTSPAKGRIDNPLYEEGALRAWPVSANWRPCKVNLDSNLLSNANAIELYRCRYNRLLTASILPTLLTENLRLHIALALNCFLFSSHPAIRYFYLSDSRLLGPFLDRKLRVRVLRRSSRFYTIWVKEHATRSNLFSIQDVTE